MSETACVDQRWWPESVSPIVSAGNNVEFFEEVLNDLFERHTTRRQVGAVSRYAGDVRVDVHVTLIALGRWKCHPITSRPSVA